VSPDSIAFLVDVDNTLLDNDGIQADLRRHLEREFGPECRDRYWAILEQLFAELGYRDYLGALQRYRVEHPKDIHQRRPIAIVLPHPIGWLPPSTREYPSGAHKGASPRIGRMMQRVVGADPISRVNLPGSGQEA
jgi:hypothetical protein